MPAGGFRGCATALRDALLTANGPFVGGRVRAAFAAALAAGQSRQSRPTRGQVVRGTLGGIPLGRVFGLAIFGRRRRDAPDGGRPRLLA